MKNDEVGELHTDAAWKAVDEVGEIHTDAAWKDSFRFSERLRQFREGVLALLAADDRLDDEILGRFGITKWDIPVEAHFDRRLRIAKVKE